MIMKVHVSPEVLEGWLDGTLDGGEAEMLGYHVRRCTVCRRHLADARLLRVLLRRRAGAPPAGDHPDDETLAAYAEERLDPGAMHSVAEHLAGCDDCLLTLIDLRTLLQDAEEPEAVPWHDPGETLRRRRMREWHGVLRIVLIGGSPLLIWLPDGGSPSRLRKKLLEDEVPVLNFMSPDARAPGHGGGPGPEPTRIPAGHHVLAVEARRTNGTLQLGMTISDRLGSTLPGIPVRVRFADGRVSESVTDAQGRAVLTLDGPPVELTVGTWPPVRLRLDMPGGTDEGSE